MACANDFWMKDKHYSNINYKIPCRYCINCRVDRKRQWIERCEYEFKKHVSGAFVTFTYDDNHIPISQGNDEKIRATLKIKDARDFIERLRKHIENHEETQSILRQKDFTYCGVGEYGENGQIWDRPHYHILFFGLDFYTNRKLFEEQWKNGIIDSLPILQGGISYVLKYIDKQIMGKKGQYENYTRWGIEAPKQFNSKGLGSGLYKENWKNAQENNGVIKSGLRDIYIPQYYRNKGLMKINEKENMNKKVENLKNYNRKIENPNVEFSYAKYCEKEAQINKEALKLYKRREESLLAKASNNGEKIYIRGTL